MSRQFRTLIFLVVAFLAVAQSIFASELSALAGTTAKQRASLQTEFMKAKLGLSGDTLEKVSALNLETAHKLQPVIDGTEGELQEIKQLRAAMAEKDTALEQLLTPPQYDLYGASKKEMRAYVEAGLEKP